MLPGLAPSVANRSPQTDTESRPSVLRVVAVEPAGHADVYCLSVPTGAAFTLANGVTVHNCVDELAYSLASRQSRSVRKHKKRKPAPGTFDWVASAPAAGHQFI
jgi:hypothetical protein